MQACITVYDPFTPFLTSLQYRGDLIHMCPPAVPRHATPRHATPRSGTPSWRGASLGRNTFCVQNSQRPKNALTRQRHNPCLFKEPPRCIWFYVPSTNSADVHGSTACAYADAVMISQIQACGAGHHVAQGARQRHDVHLELHRTAAAEGTQCPAGYCHSGILSVDFRLT